MVASTTSSWIRGLPNALSGLRLGIGVALPFLPPEAWLPAIALGGLTDALDGWIARRFGASSWFGGLLDGAADKVFLLAAVVTLVRAGRLEGLAAVPLLLRDIAVTGMGARLSLRREWDLLQHVPARCLGKVTTFGLFAILALLAAFREPPVLLDHLVLLVSLVSGTAAVDYLLRLQRLARAPGADAAPERASPARG